MDDWVTNVIESMGYAGIALLMALENILPPIPSELIMPLAGYNSDRGKVSLAGAITAGTVGTVVGTLPWYALARWLDRERVMQWVDDHGHWLTVERKELERATEWFSKHGRWTIAVGRLIPGIRTVISVPAGFCHMPVWQYLGYSAAGTVVWTAVLAYLGSLLGQNYDKVAIYLGPVSWLVTGTILCVYLVRLVRMRKHNHARRARSSQER